MPEEQHVESPFLTLPEAAAMLQFSENGLRKIMKAGRLPGLKIGGQWRIRKDFIEKMEWTTT